jgi:hypothetical protein
MALRLSYGDQPAFAFAVGGFNPRFAPPPAFPALERLTLTLAKDGGNPTIVCQTYLALTSNTAQLGVRAEISGTELGLSFRGWLGFDVLVVISPLSFLADLQAAVEVKKGGVKIATASLTATLAGPTPWHLSGRASFDFIVHYEVPGRGDDRRGRHGGALLRRSLARAAGGAPGGPKLASGARPAAAAGGQPARAPAGIEPLLDPLGGAAVHEKACPLNRRLTKFGEAGSTAQEGMTSTPTRSPLGGRRSTTGRCRTTSPPRNSNSCRMPRSSPAPASSRWTRGLSSKATP